MVALLFWGLQAKQFGNPVARRQGQTAASVDFGGVNVFQRWSKQGKVVKWHGHEWPRQSDAHGDQRLARVRSNRRATGAQRKLPEHTRIWEHQDWTIGQDPVSEFPGSQSNLVYLGSAGQLSLIHGGHTLHIAFIGTGQWGNGGRKPGGAGQVQAVDWSQNAQYLYEALPHNFQDSKDLLTETVHLSYFHLCPWR